MSATQAHDQDPRYHLAAARMMDALGCPGLADSHRLAAGLGLAPPDALEARLASCRGADAEAVARLWCAHSGGRRNVEVNVPLPRPKRRRHLELVVGGVA